MKEKEKMIREKIEELIEIIADRMGWVYYKIIELMIILDNNDSFLVADVTVNYRDENGINEQLTSRFNKITQKDLLSNAKIY